MSDFSGLDDEGMTLTPPLLRAAYAAGIFPMADGRQSHSIGWHDPHMRGILPIDGFHVPRRLRQLIRQHPFDITFNQDFAGVMAGCAGDTAEGVGYTRETWINDAIIAAFQQLHIAGDAQSVEVWQRAENGLPRQLVGGVYGMSLGGAFFGESMFSRLPNASKVGLVFLMARLWAQGFTLFDAQFHNPHLEQFGLLEIDRAEYQQLLAAALTQTHIRFEKTYSPPSKEPGSSSRVGTAEEPPETGATGAICSGARGTAGAAVAGTVTAGATGVAAVAGVAAAASSGVATGVFSAEYASDAATVASFLQAITQTS